MPRGGEGSDFLDTVRWKGTFFIHIFFSSFAYFSPVLLGGFSVFLRIFTFVSKPNSANKTTFFTHIFKNPEYYPSRIPRPSFAFQNKLHAHPLDPPPPIASPLGLDPGVGTDRMTAPSENFENQIFENFKNQL